MFLELFPNGPNHLISRMKVRFPGDRNTAAFRSLRNEPPYRSFVAVSSGFYRLAYTCSYAFLKALSPLSLDRFLPQVPPPPRLTVFFPFTFRSKNPSSLSPTICGIITLRPELGGRRRLRRGSTRHGRAARIDPIRANSRKASGSMTSYAQSPVVRENGYRPVSVNETTRREIP